jgi:hypothetical protein
MKAIEKVLKGLSPAYAMYKDGAAGLSDTLLGKINPIVRSIGRDAERDKERKDAQAMMLEQEKAKLLGARGDQKPMTMAGGGMTSRKRPIDGKATRGKTKGRMC